MLLTPPSCPLVQQRDAHVVWPAGRVHALDERAGGLPAAVRREHGADLLVVQHPADAIRDQQQRRLPIEREGLGDVRLGVLSRPQRGSARGTAGSRARPAGPVGHRAPPRRPPSDPRSAAADFRPATGNRGYPPRARSRPRRRAPALPPPSSPSPRAPDGAAHPRSPAARAPRVPQILLRRLLRARRALEVRDRQRSRPLAGGSSAHPVSDRQHIRARR